VSSQPPRLRPFQLADVAPLVDLFGRAFGRPMPEAVWRWKLDRRHAPTDNVWLAVDDDDRPIFQYAGIPCRFHLDGREVEAMISVDTMAAPEQRRRGLLTTVGRRTYQAWRDAGVALVLGLPNQQWGSRTEALGWERLFSLAWRFRPLRPEALLARRWRLPWLSRRRLGGRLLSRLAGSTPAAGLVVREITAAGAEIDRLWQRTRDQHRFSIVRDAARIGWRYLESPQDHYRILLAERPDGAAAEPAGFAALRLEELPDGRRLGWIAEVHCSRHEPASVGLLINRAVALLSDSGAELVGALAVPASPFDRALRRAGFWFQRGRFSVECVPLADNLPLAELRRPENWQLMGGDFDVI